MSTRLVHVQARGLKGQEFDLPLSGVDHILGPNFAGKSSRILAVSVGLRGQADTEKDLERDYLGPRRRNGSVTLIFDVDGTKRSVSRRLQDSNRTTAAKSASALAESIAGDQLVRWDLADFAGASENVRAKVLRQAAKAAHAQGALDSQAALAEMRSLREHVGRTGTVLDDLVERLGETVNVRWIEQALDLLQQWQRTANAAKTTAAKTVDRMTSAGRPVPRGTIEAARQKLEDARQQADQIRASAKRYEAWKSQQERAERQRAGILAEAADLVAEIERLEVLIQAAPGERVEDLEAAVRIVEERQDATTAKISSTATDLGAARARLSRMEQAMAGAPSVPGWALLPDGTWRSEQGLVWWDEETLLVTALDDGIAVPAAIVDFLRRDASEEALAAVRGEVEALERSLGNAEGFGKRLRAVHAERSEALRAGRSAIEAGEALERARKRQTQVQERLDGWAEAQEAAPAQPDEAEIAAAAAAVQSAQAKLEEHVRAGEWERTMQAAVRDRERETLAWKQAKELRAHLGAVKDRLAGSVFGPLAALAQEILDGMRERGAPSVPEALYIEDANDLGLVRDGVRVSMWELSTSERAVFGAALVSALVRLTDAPWRAVVLDNTEAINRSWRVSLCRVLADLVERGELDNVLTAGFAEAPEYLSGRTWWLDPKRGLVAVDDGPKTQMELL